MNRKTLDKMLGCFRGLAIGDALGAPVEFMPKRSFSKITDYQSGGPHNLKAGEWTDDTSMALCLSDSLYKMNGYDSFDVMKTYSEWWNDGLNSSTGECFDIGIQMRGSLINFEKDPSLNPETDSAGNGVIMRLAPAAIVSFQLSSEQAIELFRESARDTHNSELAMSSTQIFGLLLRDLLGGSINPCRSLKNACNTAGDIGQDLFEKITQTSEKDLHNGGFVVDTFVSAYNCFLSTSSFEEAVLKAVNLGDDADTVGAVTGQIAGSYYGDSKIPEYLKNGLAYSSHFVTKVEELLTVNRGVIRTRQRSI